MTGRPEPRDPAEILKRYFSTMQVPGNEKSGYVMSERNRLKLEKIHERVKQLRGER